MRQRISLVVLIAFSSYLQVARADVPQWGPGDDVTTKELGSIGRRTFTVELREQPPELELLTLRLVLRWTEPGHGTREQVLIDGFEGHSVGLESMRLNGNILSYVREPVSRFAEEGEYMVVTHRFARTIGRFTQKNTKFKQPYNEARHQLEAALRRDDLSMGRAILSMIGTSPNGGNTNLENQYFLLFLDATHRLAMRHWRAKRKLQAAALVWSLFSQPPLEPGMARDKSWFRQGAPDDNSWFAKVPRLKRSFSTMGFIRPSPKRIAQISDLAWILHEGAPSITSNAREKATELLREVVSHAPNRRPARLNLADGLWRLSVDHPGGKAADLFRLEAREHYAAYAKLVGVKQAPKRVRLRVVPVL